MSKRIEVVAAVIQGRGDQVLLSKRQAHLHQGGLWEFPGGKLEPGETEQACLWRELEEELGIRPLSATRLIRVAHDYPDKSVSLSTWQVHAFSGEPEGREGQEICWIPVGRLRELEFPAANRPIVTAAQLPDRYHITAPHWKDPRSLGQGVAAGVQRGAQLFQLRIPDTDNARLRELLDAMRVADPGRNARVLVNGTVDDYANLDCDGIHLSWRHASRLHRGDLDAIPLVGVSCHDGDEIRHAEEIGAHFAVLSAVRATASHPGNKPIGWPQFESWVKQAGIPVYALGGMRESDRVVARTRGAQGIGGISGLWVSE